MINNSQHITGLEERNRIVEHLKEAAQILLIEAMNNNQYNLETAELAATVMEETSNAIAEGDHWRNFQ